MVFHIYDLPYILIHTVTTIVALTVNWSPFIRV